MPASALLTRVLLAMIATLALLFVWHPVVVHAQAAQKTAPKAQTASKADTGKSGAPAKPRQRSAPRDTSTTTHVVKAGETLWSLATRYYGDGHQWRALARRNGIEITGDTALRVGARLQVPARSAVVASSSVLPSVRDTTVPKVATTPASSAPAPTRATTPGLAPKARPAGGLAAQTADKGDAKAGAKAQKTPAKTSTAPAESSREAAAPKVATAKDVNAATDTASIAGRSVLRPTIKAEKLITRGPAHIGIVESGDLRAARGRNESPTVFVRIVPDAAEAAEASRRALRAAAPAPRRGEFVAAPLPMAESRWLQAGHVLGRLDGTGAASKIGARLQLADEVEISAPAGTTVSVGDQLVAMRADVALPSGARVGLPTGVLQVTKADAGKPIRAYVRTQSGVIEQGQALFKVEGAPADVEKRPEATSGADIETTVSWTESSVVPTLQSYVLLAAGDAQGVKAGDEFALTHSGATGPDARIAVVRVVRTSPSGSSAVVIHQSKAEIATGVTARRIARMP